MDYDVIIVGAGVVGLSCSALLSKNKKCLLIERHPSFGRETSSRNSEVIHAGIYYPKDSLKAKLCVPGNKSLYDWCLKKGVPHRKLGKFIIAVNQVDEEELENIYNRAIANGVENIQRATPAMLETEPNIRASAALWSPNTGIVDSHKLMQSFYDESLANECDFAFNYSLTELKKIVDGWELTVKGKDGEEFKVSSFVVVNSGGLEADLIAESAGINAEQQNYRVHFARGHYFRISEKKKGLVNHLIYPTPMKNAPGLGIHVTLELNGGMKLGPDVEYLNERKQDYSVSEELKEKFFRAASLYLKDLNSEDIYPDQSGIRPKLQAKGGEFRDFIIREESDKGCPGLINLIGIESPGLTSCIEIAKMVNSLM